MKHKSTETLKGEKAKSGKTDSKAPFLANENAFGKYEIGFRQNENAFRRDERGADNSCKNNCRLLCGV
ncbi:MAG: hypothetical protein J6H19_05900 [Bacteroidaceae bacterium]|nr:hypothetical protein [Bacteroidaceae bacterium]